MSACLTSCRSTPQTSHTFLSSFIFLSLIIFSPGQLHSLFHQLLTLRRPSCSFLRSSCDSPVTSGSLLTFSLYQSLRSRWEFFSVGRFRVKFLTVRFLLNFTGREDRWWSNPLRFLGLLLVLQTWSTCQKWQRRVQNDLTLWFLLTDQSDRGIHLPVVKFRGQWNQNFTTFAPKSLNDQQNCQRVL